MERANGRSLADRNIEEPCWRSEIKISGPSQANASKLSLKVTADFCISRLLTHVESHKTNMLPFFLKDARYLFGCVRNKFSR